MACLDANDVVRVLEGESPPGFEDHIDGCSDCRALMVELARAAEVEETRIGRYIVLDPIGAGAMGVVYRAYDPDLDRDVALKLVDSHALREAQAMAKLAHPNVVAVFDASTDREHSFVAMELVDGSDLEIWLREPRTWRAIATRFADAGRGLAAAHAAGIVHRDFKPSNVLVGADGRVRVTDFGLATTEGQATKTVACGTPAYMSPEVKTGGVADARSDQYSFAIALCEALTGAREPAKLPRRLRAPVSRALAPEPAKRHPSMDALVGAIDRALHPRRAWLVLPLVAAALAIGFVATRGRDAATCEVPRDRFTGIWDAPTKTRVHDAFLATQHPLAEDTWKKVEGSLDRFVVAWSESHVAACKATQRSEQSAELLDRRMACLATERARLAALTALFVTADRAILARAPNASELTERLTVCNDVVAMRTASPVAPAMRARAAAAAAELARIETTSLRGNFAEAIAGAQRVRDEALATGDVRLEADATRSMGETQWRAGDNASAIQNLYAAVDAAKRAHAPDLEGGALLVLVAVLGYEEARYAEALQVSRLAESTMRAAGDEGRLGKLLGNRAAIHYAKADFAAAKADYEQALPLLERAYGKENRNVGQTLMNIAMVTADMADKPDAAFPLYARALVILEKELGTRHPEIANLLANRSVALANAGRHAEAMRDLERALAIRTEILGPDHRDVANTYLLIGEIADDAKDLPTALRNYRAALAHLQKSRPDHPMLASAYRGMGRAHAAAKAWPEAIDALEHALSIWDKQSLDGPQQADARFVLANALWESQGDRKRAVTLAKTAHATYTALPGQADAVAEVGAWLKEHE